LSAAGDTASTLLVCGLAPRYTLSPGRTFEASVNSTLFTLASAAAGDNRLANGR